MRASRSKNFSKNYRKALRMNFLEEIRKEAKRILELGQMTHRSFVPELTRPMIKRWNPTRSRRTPPMLASDKAKAGTASGPPQPASTGPAGRMMMSERHKNIRENQEPRPSGNFRQYDQRGSLARPDYGRSRHGRQKRSRRSSRQGRRRRSSWP